MHVVDRFTRDEASAKVWWPFALLLIVLVVLSFPARNRAIATERDEATDAASAIVTGTVFPAMSGLDPSDLSDAEAAELDATLHDDVLEEEPLVTTIRLWDRAGHLLLSTDPTDDVGSAAALNDPLLAEAADSPGVPVATTTDQTLTREPSDVVHDRIYQAAPGTPPTIVEVEIDDDAMLADLRSSWLAIQIAVGVAALLVLVLAGLSVREPLARIGAGVPFYETSVPPDLAVVSHEEAIQLRQSSDHARAKIAANQERIQELEEANLRLEGELQRALSATAIANTRPSSVIARPSSTPPAPVGPAHEVPQAPAASKAAIVDERDVTVVVPSKQRGRRKVPTEPVATPAVEPAAQPAAEAPTIVPEPVPEPIVLAPEPILAEEPEPVAVTPEPEPISTPEPEPIAMTSEPERIPTPEPEPVIAHDDVVRIPDARSSDTHDEDVIEVLERLVPPAGRQALHPELDPGEIRARLAKTAASKKPGGRDERFREHTDT
jgi:hypothetical protein